MKLVFIKWIDSKSGSPEWEFLNEIEPLKPVICESVGFLLADADDYKTLTSTFGGGQIWGRITIPTCAIIDFKEITYESSCNT